MTSRPIRSYVLRSGKLTKGQQSALDELWSSYGLSLGELAGESLDIKSVFGNSKPAIMEIGFGDGEALIEAAVDNPQNNFIGIEVHRPGVGHFLMRAHLLNLVNVKVFCEDAIDVLDAGLGDESLSKICLFFPDPWPKKKHHKRRIVQPGFIDLVIKKLRPGGVFHYATDWKDYAYDALEKLEKNDLLENIAGQGNFCPRPEERPETKFEKRGKRLGHGVWDIVMKK